MNIWFMVWVFLAVFIFGASLWSHYILLRQKRAWESFSKKCSLEYSSPAVLKSPVLRGLLKGLPFEMTSEPPLAGKPNEMSLRTAIQFTLKSPMPTSGAICSGGFRNYINGLFLPEAYKPDFAGWSDDISIRSFKSADLVEYLTKERLTAINALFCMKNASCLLIFNADATVLRIETSEPFDDEARLEKFLNKAAEAAKIISI